MLFKVYVDYTQEIVPRPLYVGKGEPTWNKGKKKIDGIWVSIKDAIASKIL